MLSPEEIHSRTLLLGRYLEKRTRSTNDDVGTALIRSSLICAVYWFRRYRRRHRCRRPHRVIRKTREAEDTGQPRIIIIVITVKVNDTSPMCRVSFKDIEFSLLRAIESIIDGLCKSDRVAPTYLRDFFFHVRISFAKYPAIAVTSDTSWMWIAWPNRAMFMRKCL